MISSLTEMQTPTEVLLMTAAVQIIGENGRKFRTRAFLDPGAQASFVAAKFVEEAGLPGVRRTRVAVQAPRISAAGMVRMKNHEKSGWVHLI